ncbi:MAG: hypothetical protein HY918_03580 [Candidatus Doudnabacteria bacterium]|nr:hypothetical protein [Candidatus Doudnabacteria bacterium]
MMDRQAQSIAFAIKGAPSFAAQISEMQDSPEFLLSTGGVYLFYAGFRCDVMFNGSVATVLALSKEEIIEEGPHKTPKLDSRSFYKILYNADYVVLVEDGVFIPLKLLTTQDGVFLLDYALPSFD